jgi:hypothetical protein
MKIIKPVNLNLEKMIVDNKKYNWLKNNQGKIGLLPELYKGKNIRKYIPEFYYFIHLILINSTDKKNKCWLYQYQDYTRTFPNQLSEVGINYKKMIQVINFLVGLKIITVKGVDQGIKTKTGTFTKNIRYYKINEPFNGEIERYDIKLNFKKISDKKIEIKLFDKSFLQHQYDRQKEVNFNSTAAKKHVESLYKEKSISNIQYVSYYNSIERIENKSFYFIVSANCDRVITSINGLSKELRGYIQDNDNNALKEIDYSTTNVFLLYKMFVEFYEGLENGKIKIKVGSIEEFKIELEKYKMFIDQDFYQSIAEIFSKNGDIIDRDTAKNIVLIDWINFNLEYKNDRYNKIKEIFPRLTGAMNFMKKKGAKSITRENYLKFSNSIMKLESKLINEICYSRIMTEYPDCIIYTIFDEFLVESRYVEKVKNIMIEEGLKFTGYNVKVKIK